MGNICSKAAFSQRIVLVPIVPDPLLDENSREPANTVGHYHIYLRGKIRRDRLSVFIILFSDNEINKCFIYIILIQTCSLNLVCYAW